MNVQDDPNSWAVQKFGIGQPVPRTEDPILVQGHGRYTDDVSLTGQAYAAIVRSSHAHGVIKGIDTEAARAMPGVLAVYHRRRSSGRRLWHAQMRAAAEEPRRHADEEAAAAGACGSTRCASSAILSPAS